MLKVVIDTNVLVSALLKGNSPPAFILALLRKRMMTLCLSKAIFEEYRAVLDREKFRHIKEAATPLLLSIKKGGLLVEPKLRIDVITADPADNKFLECAQAAQADFLITGNTKHFPFKHFEDTRIVSPKEFIEYALALIIKTH
ncbi:MAG: putative toxin-antitoxin system toxin component, PIN family [Nitrospirae bacterium]|nr:putative toxin-antitoxin system toxin component, PIN family [Nitrospirota bacterium]